MHETQQWDDILNHYIDEYRHLPTEIQVKKLTDQLMSLFSVGYFTTYSLISWILVEMSLNPHIEQRITEEVKQVLGGGLPNYNDIGSLNYLSLVIKESLRLHPSVFAIMRETSENDVIGDYFIQRNSGVTLSTYHIHRHRDFWHAPEKFDPERFRNNPLGQNNRFAYIPFGGAQRRCPGASFSSLEVTIVIALLVQQFNLSLLPNTTVQPHITTLLTMNPNVHHMLLHFKNNN